LLLDQEEASDDAPKNLSAPPPHRFGHDVDDLPALLLSFFGADRSPPAASETIEAEAMPRPVLQPLQLELRKAFEAAADRPPENP